MADAAQYYKKSVVHYPSGYLPIGLLALIGIAKIPLITLVLGVVACILTLIDVRFVRVKYRAHSAYLVLHRYSTAASIADALARSLPLNGKRVRSLSEGGPGYDSGKCIPLRYWNTWAIDFYHFVTYYVVTEEDEGAHCYLHHISQLSYATRPYAYIVILGLRCT